MCIRDRLSVVNRIATATTMMRVTTNGRSPPSSALFLMMFSVTPVLFINWPSHAPKITAMMALPIRTCLLYTSVILMIGIGILYLAVTHSMVKEVLNPFLLAVIPSNRIAYIIFFSLLAPLSLYLSLIHIYGAYNMVGACSGVLASVVLTQCLARLEFPFSFRCVFLLGLISALIATVVVCVGVREVTDDRVREKIRLRDIFPIGTQILRENRGFRNYTIIKILVGAAEFAIPYYIKMCIRDRHRSDCYIL